MYTIVTSFADSEWFFPDPDLVHIIYVQFIWKLLKKHTLNSIEKKGLPTICHFLVHTSVLYMYSTHSQEFTGLKWEIKF